jgi:phosphohistidine phosphatase
MQLILWRHAEAEDNAPSDLLRPLTLRGRKQAAKVAGWLHEQLGSDLPQWRVIASPALRAQQTATALQLPVQTVETIAPDCGAHAVLAAAGWPHAAQNVIVVGHQPTLGMVAARLINGADGYISIRKGAMWWFESRDRQGGIQTVLRAMVTPDTVS